MPNVLKNAPLIYTIGAIHFPRIPNFARFVDGIFERIRASYPQFDPTIQTSWTTAIGSDNNIRVTQSETPLWQFADAARTWGVVLSDASICLHTAHYDGFDDFVGRYETIIDALLNVPELNINITTGIGFRYVDMIVPKEGETLKDYLHSWVLPTEPPKTSSKLIEGIYVARCKTEIGEVRFSAFRNPPFTLPPDLQSGLVEKNGWLKLQPKIEFALIDTDHFVQYTRAEPLSKEFAVRILKDLRRVGREIFDQVGTEKALETWR